MSKYRVNPDPTGLYFWLDPEEEKYKSYSGVWVCLKKITNRYWLKRYETPSDSIWGEDNGIFLDFNQDGAWITDFVPQETIFKVNCRPATEQESILARLGGEV